MQIIKHDSTFTPTSTRDNVNVTFFTCFNISVWGCLQRPSLGTFFFKRSKRCCSAINLTYEKRQFLWMLLAGPLLTDQITKRIGQSSGKIKTRMKLLRFRIWPYFSSHVRLIWTSRRTRFRGDPWWSGVEQTIGSITLRGLMFLVSKQPLTKSDGVARFTTQIQTFQFRSGQFPTIFPSPDRSSWVLSWYRNFPWAELSPSAVRCRLALLSAVCWWWHWPWLCIT